MKIEEIQEIVECLKNNSQLVCDAANLFPPQNSRDFQVLESVITTQNMLRAVVKYLIEMRTVHSPPGPTVIAHDGE